MKPSYNYIFGVRDLDLKKGVDVSLYNYPDSFLEGGNIKETLL